MRLSSSFTAEDQTKWERTKKLAMEKNIHASNKWFQTIKDEAQAQDWSDLITATWGDGAEGRKVVPPPNSTKAQPLAHAILDYYMEMIDRDLELTDTPSFNAVLEATFETGGKQDQMLPIFEDMLKLNLKPNMRTLVVMMQGAKDGDDPKIFNALMNLAKSNEDIKQEVFKEMGTNPELRQAAQEMVNMNDALDSGGRGYGPGGMGMPGGPTEK